MSIKQLDRQSEDPNSPEAILQNKLNADEKFADLAGEVVAAINIQLGSCIEFSNVIINANGTIEIECNFSDLNMDAIQSRNSLIAAGISCDPIHTVNKPNSKMVLTQEQFLALAKGNLKLSVVPADETEESRIALNDLLTATIEGHQAMGN